MRRVLPDVRFLYGTPPVCDNPPARLVRAGGEHAVKRHFRDGQGRLLQSDKGWRDLKLKQREWISDELRTRYLAAYDATGKAPSKKECDAIVREVIGLIEARNIWIPSREVFAYFSGRKGRWLGRHLRRLEAAACAEGGSAAQNGEGSCES